MGQRLYGGSHGCSELAFSFVGDVDSPVACAVIPGLGHALELRAYSTDGVMHLDWWYDARQFEGYTVEELAEQFPLALIEITSEAVPPVRDAA